LIVRRKEFQNLKDRFLMLMREEILKKIMRIKKKIFNIKQKNLKG